MKQIDQTYTIKAPIEEVWQALTDAGVMDFWGAKPAKMDARAGGEFSLWDGDIHGTNTKVEAPHVLAQDWYGHDEPDRLYKVVFMLSFKDGTTTIHLQQADVPDDQAKDMEAGWRDYYFEPIKKLLETH